MPKHDLCDCGNVMECVEEDEVIKPEYRSIYGNLYLRCNDYGEEHEVFLGQKLPNSLEPRHHSMRFHHPNSTTCFSYELKRTGIFECGAASRRSS
jgi:hypothetical protein